ncbi:flagellar hook protein FlgK [Actinotalea ferrariae CF5-4]|uniref:Flagellar hook-associated protein 1 n=1 Tax=Actinotalea ferrariae CF5-4 TaxID=948458 RepID=A0A021W162_9CELL|nr:flagellar hook-associated protein FlgK [Actinotalea ferrariae]EYR65062.1 flagellar hook protein FlgK [Actinotalea ferrariae CF5-4]
MSTFSGLSTALSSLIAQRQALDVAGQNIANANTVGYTRQRANLQSVEALTAPTMFSNQLAAGNGVKVTDIARLGDVFLDARVRAETGTAAFQKAQAQSLDRLQSTLTEPSATGFSASLQEYWAAWEDVANRPDDAAARKVVLGAAETVRAQIAAGYRSVETQWSQMRTETDTLVTEVNSTAAEVANLNEQIRSILVSGGSANELMDRRDLAITKLSGLVGAEARHREDGTVDVMVGGNALVRGVQANEVVTRGSYEMGPGTSSDPVHLEWRNTGTRLDPGSGRLASHLTDLSDRGLLAGAAQTWNQVASALADTVNAVHATGIDQDGGTGQAFFAYDPARPAASLSIAVTDPRQVAAAAPGQGALDGSWAQRLSGLGLEAGSPDLVWRSFVVDLGVRTRAAEQRATITETARATSQNLQLSQASVDLDEETVMMLATQRAYEGAARVLTAVDEMLDVLINRTGLVGR